MQVQIKDKVVSAIGQLTKDEMDSMDESQLRTRIVQANQAMKETQEELDNNERYQQIKESKKVLEQGKNEVNKRQKAIIQYALRRMDEMGKVDTE